MLTHKEICTAINKIAKEYNVKSASYFGSYANGTQTEASDLDILVEFETPFISFFTIGGMALKLENDLNVKIDIVSKPLPSDTHLVIDRQIKCYG